MKQYMVDAFTDRIFHGNPAAVCVLERWLADELMMSLADENHLSETAFVVKESESYRLRWFTPGGEIDLCGHATLATAFVLLNYYVKNKVPVSFETISGTLTVTQRAECARRSCVWIGALSHGSFVGEEAKQTVIDGVSSIKTRRHIILQNGRQQMIFKRKIQTKSYDKENCRPVLRCSICTGEQVAGFKNIHTGRFEEATLIRNDRELKEFMQMYGIDTIAKEY